VKWSINHEDRLVLASAEAIASARGRQLVSPRAAELAERIAAAP